MIKTTTHESIRIISHELIHVKQLYENRINVVDDKFFWLGKEYTPNSFNYEERPWEIEAFNKEKEVADKIKKQLYQ